MLEMPHGSQLDADRVHRAAKNLVELFEVFIETMQEKAAETEPIRNRILADVKALYQSVPARDRGLILSTLAVETQKLFDQGGSPKVGIDGGCVGEPGGGITASEGRTSVKLCVMGSVEEGIQGGGIEVSTTC